ncbi:MAG: mechanosensitive ion channel domain-containing protein [Marinibacterium sp.]
MVFLVRLLATGLIAFFCLAGVSFAQSGAAPSASAEVAAGSDLPDPLTPEAVQAMVARMSDDEVRAMLLDRLDAVARATDANAPPPTLASKIVAAWSAFSFSVGDAFAKFPAMLAGEASAIRTFFERYTFGGAMVMFALIALTLAIAYGAERLVGAALRRWQKDVTRDTDGDGETTLMESVSFLFRRFLRELAGLVAFYITLRIVGRLLLTPDQIAFAAPFVVYLIWMPRLGAAVSRFILAPNRPDMRLVYVSDKWAQYLYRNLVGLVFLGGLTLFVVGFNIRNGVPAGEIRIGFWFDSAVYLYIILIALQAREGLISMMRGTEESQATAFENKVARAYPYFAIAVAAGMWVIVNTLVGMNEVKLLIAGAHYQTMFWLLIAPLLDTLIRGLTRHLVPPMIGEGPAAEAAHEATKRSYIRIGRVIAVALIAVIIARIWQIDLTPDSTADGAAAGPFQFVMILAVGYIAFEAAALWVNRRIAREQTSLAGPVDPDGGEPAEVGGEGGGAGGSRLTTVLPLVLWAVQATIVIVFVLLALGSLGIDTTPLLASAGVLGLAIGFGAQKLVADVVSGIFFLVDDAFRVGEYVDVGGTTGTVEKISIRSMQLRHHRGPVHTIPYGEISKLTNYSRDWVIMKLKFTVPFDTDPNRVKKIFKKIGAEMMENELYKNDFLEPFKSQGVFDFDDVGMIIRGKFMAKPGTQFTIRKEIYNKVKAAFKEAGIDFARREVRVAIPGLNDEHDDDLTDQERTAAIAAAGAAGAAAQQAQENKG